MTTAFESAGVIPEWNTADRFRKAREFRGLTQAELGEAMSVARSTIQRVEQGVAEPRRTLITAWAFATGVNRDWLETGKTPAEGGNPPNGGEAWALRGSNPGPAD
ncbi:helix-turn-helix domain-containing protein [Corynebacterium diphtheriae]|uniref:helix-turn-helix domain-containing protein n=1 Tax=Corynebacterium diphtheriae TaxID=1717 RepID=UPI000D052797|nr:helix-turn-helix transcriptional regulator [Corynebacterium diphtheriae]PSA75556.1 transcriptional regulator [Corynebacterium diphtheriae]